MKLFTGPDPRHRCAWSDRAAAPDRGGPQDRDAGTDSPAAARVRMERITSPGQIARKIYRKATEMGRKVRGGPPRARLASNCPPVVQQNLHPMLTELR
jgi:hypothetical protein